MLSGSEIVAQIVSFLILFFVMRHFVWKRLLGIIDERRRRIEDEYSKIEAEKNEAASLRKAYEEKLARIEEEARKKMQEALSVGKQAAQELKQQAYRDANDIVENARENVRFELAKIKETLKNEVIDLSIRAAEEIVQEKLTEQTDRRLVQDFLDKINQSE